MNVRTIKNVHGLAMYARLRWAAGSLGGEGKVLSEDNIHVYGWHRRSMTPVNVQFTNDWITIIRKPTR
jgi:hypothetical protein